MCLSARFDCLFHLEFYNINVLIPSPEDPHAFLPILMPAVRKRVPRQEQSEGTSPHSLRCSTISLSMPGLFCLFHYQAMLADTLPQSTWIKWREYAWHSSWSAIYFWGSHGSRWRTATHRVVMNGFGFVSFDGEFIMWSLKVLCTVML